MSNLKTIKLMTNLALGAVGFMACSALQKLNEKPLKKISSSENFSQDATNGFKISDINDSYLQSLARSIDNNKALNGKEKDVLENGKEMSVFLKKAGEIIYLNKKDEKRAKEILNKIADFANEDTYIEFKNLGYRRSNSVFEQNFMSNLLDKMKKRFEENNSNMLIANTDEQEVTDYEIDNKYSYEVLVKTFYPSLINLCGGSLKTAVIVFKQYAKIDDEEGVKTAKIKLPGNVGGCEINQNGFKTLNISKNVYNNVA